MGALPAQPLLRVVLRPHVVGRERVDDPRIVGLEVIGDLGPGADPDPVGLRDAAVLKQGTRRRLLVGPYTLLERAAQLGMVRLAHEVVALVVEGGIEEEAVVLEVEVLVVLADPALAKREQLLTLGQRAHRHGPLFEGNRHLVSRLGVLYGFTGSARGPWAPSDPVEGVESRESAHKCQICDRCCKTGRATLKTGRIWLSACVSGVPEAAAAGRLDSHPVAGLKRAGGLRRQLLAVEQIAPRRAVGAAVTAPRPMPTALGDQREAHRRQRLELAHDPLAAAVRALAAAAATD